MAITEYNYIPKYIERTIANKPKDVVTASYWNELFNLLITQGDHTAKELGNVLNHLTTVITGTASETIDAIAEEHEYASAFEIHLNTSTNPITADKPFAEIRQAIVDKREILLWVSEVQCLKPTCKAFEHTITLVVFDYSFDGPVVRADVYECYDENEWFIRQNIELAKQNNVGDIRDLTTTHKSDLVSAINEVKQTADDKQDKLIAGENITIADDGKTISSAGKANALGYFRATYTRQSAEDFTLGKTFAQVKEEIANNNLIMLVDNFSDIDGMFILTYNSSGTVAFTAMIDDAKGWLTFAVTSDDKWQVDVQSRVAFDMYDALSKEVGNTLNLTTTDKTSLVAAINEVKQTTDNKQDKLIAGENITIAADGKTISATGGGGGSVPKPLTYDYMPEGYPTKAMGTVTLMEEQDVAFEAMNDTIRSASLTNAFEIAEGQICIVNWDGAEYECVAFVFAGEGIALGNLSITGTGNDTGEPFLCGYNNSDGVYNRFFTLDTSASHTISIKRVDEVITPMAYKYMPEGYPSKSGQIATLMEEQGLAFVSWHGDIYKANSPNPLAIAEGKTYAVNWDGTEYKCVCAVSYSDPVIGNLSIIGEGKDTGEPFIYVCYIDETNTSFYTLDPSATHTISVKEVETIIPMSAEFIPHMNVSAFTNDAGYLTLATLPKYGGEVV